MCIQSGAIVEIEDGTSEKVLGDLGSMPNIIVFGVKDNHIVTVIQGSSIRDIEAAVKTVVMMKSVIGVYPIFTVEND